MSYDFFSYLHKTIGDRLEKEDPKAFAQVLEPYSKSRDLSSIAGKYLDTKVSSGIAWQIAELSHHVFSSYAKTKSKQLGQEIEHLQKNPKADENNKKRLKKLKRDNLDSLQDTKPVWGKPYRDNFPIMTHYIKDNEDERIKDSTELPTLCFRTKIQVPMKTNIPIVVKGDRPFVASENPFCIDKVTGWPLLRPSALKGQTRYATLASLIEENSPNPEPRVDAIFGPEDVDKEKGHRGRVEFLPCYVESPVDFDIIAPHDEKTRRVDPGPVTLEVIRPKTLTLWLQYWPLDLMSKWYTGKRYGIGQELFDDFDTILKGLSYWFDAVGIGAKTSSGYGKVKYHEGTAQVFAAPESPWAKLAKKFFDDESTARPIYEISQALKREEWDNIWNVFEQSLKKGGDENAG
jgi:CRISPR/Cas system CMR subunit Cmr6 (Cas7 group RAMP superfamily)